jgi:hypothetical protein
MRLKATKAGMLWVNRTGDRRSWTILPQDFLVKNPSQEKLNKFRELLSQSR